MKENKVFVFLPDGGGLRNFVYSAFSAFGEATNYKVIYWNKSLFPIKENLGHEELVFDTCAPHPLTSLYTRARKRVELNISKRKFNDPVYETYKFPLNFKGLKNALKSIYVLFLIQFYAKPSGLKRLRKRIEQLERKHSNYKVSKQQLEEHRPSLVFCSNQRNTQAIGPILAAKDLGIKTVCFVQSWDNVPKAMQVVETDYYCVWSELMKRELLQYYPYIKAEQVFVTGTPQFEPHFDTTLLKSRTEFFKTYGLDLDMKYICYSGDDETTSPLDQFYLQDLAIAVRTLNEQGQKLGVIFRRCPVDFSNRYDEVIAKFPDIIQVISPIWEKRGEQVVEVLPRPEDAELLYNICEHSELVTNVCSSTVFDFVVHSKPCLYYNYEQPQLKKGIRDIGQNYNYVHFRSMPANDAVVFCRDKKDLKGVILKMLKGELSNVKTGRKWFEVVAGPTPSQSSENIWKCMLNIMSETVK